MLLLLFAAAAAAPAAQQPFSLRQGEAFFTTAADGQRTTVLAPGAELGGEQVAVVPSTASEEACAKACRGNAACGWFGWCEQIEGCALSGSNATLSHRDCLLLGGNCTLVPPVAARFSNVTSGEGRQQAGCSQALAVGYNQPT